MNDVITALKKGKGPRKPSEEGGYAFRTIPDRPDMMHCDAMAWDDGLAYEKEVSGENQQEANQPTAPDEHHPLFERTKDGFMLGTYRAAVRGYNGASIATFRGRVVANPQLRKSFQGTEISTFTVSFGYDNKPESERAPDAPNLTVVYCIVVGNMAREILRWLRRGDVVVVAGRFLPWHHSRRPYFSGKPDFGVRVCCIRVMDKMPESYSKVSARQRIQKMIEREAGTLKQIQQMKSQGECAMANRSRVDL